MPRLAEHLRPILPGLRPGLLAAALALLVLVVLPFVVPALGSARAEPAVAVAVDLAADGPRTRIQLTLSRPVEARAAVMERPDRLVIDLPDTVVSAPDTPKRREGAVAAIRYGLFAPGRSRVVVDLAGPALVSRIESAPRAVDGATILTIELTKTEREAFRRAAAAPPPERVELRGSEGPASAQPPAADKRPTIVIDAGHGGVDPGAIAATGLYEKDIVFAVAQRLARRLGEGGRYRVVATRGEDVFVPLTERVKIARTAKADLFVSIHADSISSAPQVRGATIYTGSERATDAESAKLADRENRADAAAGLDPGAGPGDVADILQELMLRETRGFSHRFAQRLLTELGPVVELSPKPQREAGFKVLLSPDVPSVLVELGYLSSKRDLDLLTSEAWREQVTGSMAAAIDRFFAARAAPERAAEQRPR